MAARSRPHPPLAGVVAIGASEGGLEPLRTFFRSLPSNTGGSYIVVEHPALDESERLPEALGNDTTMRRRRAAEGMVMRPGEVLFLPADAPLRLRDGVLRREERPGSSGPPIDAVFRSLASALGPALIGVLLSGTGSHGTRGLQAVKAHGGLTIVQDPGTAEFAEMPSSAIRSRAADDHGSVPELAANVAEVLERMQRRVGEGPASRQSLLTIAEALQRRTGHDLRRYNQDLLSRRVQRRLLLRGFRDADAYARALREDHDEAEALFRDLMIPGTEFFDGAEAWKALEEDIVPRLFEERDPRHPIRAWVPGCATGEEAYSLAISLEAYSSRLERPPGRPRIFSTHVDQFGLAFAREGLYPAGIAAEMGTSRLDRFFSLERGHYRVIRAIQGGILFAPHDILRDRPFARQTLVTCQHLLRHLEPEAREQIVRTLAYALEPGGYLFAGSSTGLIPHSELFDPVDEAHGIFRRNAIPAPLPTGSIRNVPAGGNPSRRTGAREADKPEADAAEAVAPEAIASESRPPDPDTPGAESLEADAPAASRRTDVRRDVERTLLDAYSPAAVLINAQDEVLQLFGPTRQYFEPSGTHGEGGLIDMALPGLGSPLREAIREARITGQTATRRSLSVASFEQTRPAELTVRPASRISGEGGLLLVVLREQGGVGEGELQETRARLDTTMAELGSAYQELSTVDSELRSHVAEFDAAERGQRQDPRDDDDHKSNWFLATLGHELRNALMPLQSSLALLREGDSVASKHERLVEIALRQLDHLTRLVGDLLDISRITQGKLTLRKVRLDLSELVREAVEDNRTEMEDAGLSVRLDLSDEKIWTDADPHRLTQAIGNLLDNARKYTSPGGTVRIRTAPAADEDAEVVVEDTGIGIPREAFDYVFEPFRQGDAGPGTPQTGMGVGLALVRTIADAHGGAVTGESEGPGTGARFTIRLPRQEPDEESASPEPRQSWSSGSSPRRVLIVEDHPLTAETTSFVLVRAGHTVAVAHSAEAAMDRLADFEPEVLLCDLGLRGPMTGYDLARMIRSGRDTSHLRLVALTGYGQEEDRRNAREAGFDAFLTKPVSPVELDLAVTGEEPGDS